MPSFPPTLRPRTRRQACIALGLLSTFAQGVQADAGPAMPAKVPVAYTQECAACHTAYPPGMLPQASWTRVMAGLDKHYGTDATLDAATVQQLSVWLQAHAGTYKRVAESPPQDRITRSVWFQRKHRQIEPAVWQLASVKSAANCAACHTGADQGRFDDDHLRLPPGLGPQMLRAWKD